MEPAIFTHFDKDMVIEPGPGRSKFEEAVEFFSEARARAERLVAQATRSGH